MTDLANFKTESMTEQDVKEFVTSYKKEGLTVDQVGQLAIQKGLPVGEWNKLQQRIAKVELEEEKKLEAENKRSVSSDSWSAANKEKDAATQSKEKSKEKAIDPDREFDYSKLYKDLKVFGASLFNRDELTFEPNLNLPTPKNYMIGAEDVLIIDIYGLSENSYKLTVSPEGNIRVPQIGLIQVSGLTIEAAQRTIRNKLSSIYSSIQSQETFVSVTIGHIRSIKVILAGEVYRPGTYTLPSVASVFNALNSAGGPNNNGSFRNIKLIRNGEIIAKLDIYTFLHTGILENNLILQDQDIIRVEPYDKRIEIEGEVKNIGFFETTGKETFADLIGYAGGFTNNAYKERVTILRNTSKERSVADIKESEFANFVLENGDKFIIGKILDRFTNRVQIAGAVYRPGVYALESNMTVKTLIAKADGVIEDAFLSRGIIVREQDDRTKEMLAFNIEKLLNGTAQDITLRKEDSIYISSIKKMREERYVSIWGEVQKEGEYNYSENMTLKDLIFIAGGVSDKAELSSVEVSRPIKDPQQLKLKINRTESFTFSVDRGLSVGNSIDEFVLQPLDQIIVRPISGFEDAKRITIEGEVFYPGSYIITSKNERISDVIKRAGGINNFAFTDGAFLIRNQKTTLAKEKLDKVVFEGVSQGDTLVDKTQFLNNEGIIGLDLGKILQSKHSKWDLILEDGDIINIPRQLETVQVAGEVFLPVYVRYDKSMSFKDYVNNAGGFSEKARKRKSFVVYANGQARSTKNFLFFKKYPKVKPGTRIHVPTKPERQGMSAGEAMGIATSTTSLAAVLISLIK